MNCTIIDKETFELLEHLQDVLYKSKMNPKELNVLQQMLVKNKDICLNKLIENKEYYLSKCCKTVEQYLDTLEALGLSKPDFAQLLEEVAKRFPKCGNQQNSCGLWQKATKDNQLI